MAILSTKANEGKFGVIVNTRPIAVLCPGAEYGAAKRWPETHYAGLANRLIDQGYQVWLFGSQKDIDVCHTINHLAKNRCVNFAGETGLEQARQTIESNLRANQTFQRSVDLFVQALSSPNDVHQSLNRRPK